MNRRFNHTSGIDGKVTCRVHINSTDEDGEIFDEVVEYDVNLPVHETGEYHGQMEYEPDEDELEEKVRELAEEDYYIINSLDITDWWVVDVDEWDDDDLDWD